MDFDSGGVINLEFLGIRVINCRNFGYSLRVVIGTIMFIIVIRYDSNDILSVDDLLILFKWTWILIVMVLSISNFWEFVYLIVEILDVTV